MCANKFKVRSAFEMIAGNGYFLGIKNLLVPVNARPKYITVICGSDKVGFHIVCRPDVISSLWLTEPVLCLNLCWGRRVKSG